MIGFPVEMALGRLSPQQALVGLATQLAWVAMGLLLISIVWRAATRRFTAVGA